MKTLYLDIFSGLSGDMFLGAMLDLGVDFDQLQAELSKLKLGGYHLHFSRQQRSGIEGVKFDVHLEHDHAHPHAPKDEPGRHHHHGHDHSHEHAHSNGHSHTHPHAHHHHHEDEGHHASHNHSHEHEHEHHHDDGHDHDHGRTFADIQSLIESSGLSGWVKDKSISVFKRIAAAEGKIHGVPESEVHFHEVGAVDSIVDIVGACAALELLGKPRVLAAAPVEGTGWVMCAHGRFPVPTAATLEILGASGIPLTQCEEPHELITPTGAALLAEFAESFGPMRGLVAERVGYGLGARQNKTRPNVVRAILSSKAAETSANDWQTDTISVLETNLDDSPAELLGHFMETALAAGALDVFHTPIQMKKGRPATLLTVLCAVSDADRFSELLLRETSAFGVRRAVVERRKLQREFATVQTPFGEVVVKIGKLNGQTIHATPEYESCRTLARDNNIPLKDVYEAVNRLLLL